MLIPEREGGKDLAKVRKKGQEMRDKKLILKIHHFPFPNLIITTMEIQCCSELYKAINKTHLEYFKTSIRLTLKAAVIKNHIIF